MLTIIVLVGAVLGFRLLGALGVRRFASWPVSAAHGMAVLLMVTASAHFVPAGSTLPMPDHGDLVAMVPPFVPFPGFMVYLSGVLEVLGAVGLVLASARWVAGIGLTALFVALFPANVYAALAEIPFNGGEATPLWLRAPEQLLFIGVTLWAIKGAERAPARRVLAAIRRPAATPTPTL